MLNLVVFSTGILPIRGTCLKKVGLPKFGVATDSEHFGHRCLPTKVKSHHVGTVDLSQAYRITITTKARRRWRGLSSRCQSCFVSCGRGSGVSRLAICCRIPKSPNHKPLIMRIKD